MPSFGKDFCNFNDDTAVVGEIYGWIAVNEAFCHVGDKASGSLDQKLEFGQKISAGSYRHSVPSVSHGHELPRGGSLASCSFMHAYMRTSPTEYIGIVLLVNMHRITLLGP